MNKSFKYFAVTNIIIIIVFFIMEVYYFFYEYNYYNRVLSFSQPCTLIFRIPHYILGVLLIYGSLNFLIKTKGLILIVIPCIGFVSYDIVQITSLFIRHLNVPCFMSSMERLQFLYIYFLLLLFLILIKWKTLAVSLSKVIFILIFLSFIILFSLLRLIIN